MIQNAIGQVYTIKPDYIKALEYYTKAFDILKEIDQKDVATYLEMSSFLEDIGALYALQKNKTKCLSYYYQSLLMKKDIYGDFHVEIGLIYEKIGNLNLDFEDGLTALENYRNALEAYQKNEAQNYVSVIRLLEHIGKLTVLESENEQDSKDLFEKGIGYIIRCINAQEKYLIKNNEDENEWKISILNYIAFLYYEGMEYEKSVLYMKKSLTILENFYKNATNEKADILNNIGVSYYKQGRNSEAFDNSCKGLEIRMHLNGKNDSSVANSLNVIVKICKELKDQENVEKYQIMLNEAMKAKGLNEDDLQTGFLRFKTLNN